MGFAKDYYTIVFGFTKQATIIFTDTCILTFCLYVRTNLMTANKLQIEWSGIYWTLKKKCKDLLRIEEKNIGGGGV